MTQRAMGTVFTRNPQTGAPRVSGKVVLEDGGPTLPLLSLRDAAPQAYARLLERAAELERERGDAQQLAFEVVEGELREGELRALDCGPEAALKIAVDLAREGRISREEALLRVPAAHLALVPTFAPAERRGAARQGRRLAAWRGNGGPAVSGVAVFDEVGARAAVADGQGAILFTEGLTPMLRRLASRLVGLVVVEAAPVAPAAHRHGWTVVEGPLRIEAGRAEIDGRSLLLGDIVSIDGSGEIWSGPMGIEPGRLSAEATELLRWADDVRRLGVRATVSNLADVEEARRLGAADVGLCRLEEVLLHPSRLPAFQRVLCAILHNEDGADEALEREAAEALRALIDAAGSTFVVRLMDSPISLLLQYWIDEAGLVEARDRLGAWLGETNPLQGVRAGRLALMRPALLDMQMRVIRAAAVPGKRLQVMVPGVVDARELERLPRGPYEVGSMLETPRACLTADRLASVADFLSFGTGDLTETTCALSRYDAHYALLPALLDEGVLEVDPYVTVDVDGVGALMRIAVDRARTAKPAIELGICGAQAADPRTVGLCEAVGLDYVSVRPPQVAVARLAAAQAWLLRGR